MRYGPAVAALEQKIARGELDPVFVIGVSDPLLGERVLSALRDKAVPPQARGFNYDVVDGPRVTANQILAAATTLPMMAERRMVLVRDLSGLPAAELSRLVPYLEDPNPTTVLVGLCGKIDGRKKFFARAKKLGFTQELAVPRKLGPWLREEVERQGASVSPAAQRRLVDVIGGDLSRLSLSIGQLALYAHGRTVEVDDVDDLIAETRERNVFELTDAIGAGDQRRALVAVSSLCDQRQSGIGGIMMLARHMRQLAVLKGAVDRGVRGGALAREVGAPPFVVDKLSGQARRYSPRALATALERIAGADRELKGLGSAVKVLGRALAERVVLERLATELIELGATTEQRRR